MRSSLPEPKQRRLPRWLKALALLMGILVLLRLLGIIEMSNEWLAGIIAFEIAIGLFELSLILIVLRYFYKKNRARGKSKTDAWISSEVDRARAIGVPEKFVRLLEKALRFELRLYRRVYYFFRTKKS